MAWCADRGIPHSVFCGRVVDTGDPLWLPEDRDKVLEVLALRGSTCSCGTREDEWKADRFAYVVDSHVCPGCELLDREQEVIREAAENRPDVGRGIKLSLIPAAVFAELHPDGAPEPDYGAPS